MEHVIEEGSHEQVKAELLIGMKGMTASEAGLKCLAENQLLVTHFFTMARRNKDGDNQCETGHTCLLNMCATFDGMNILRGFVPAIHEWLIISLQSLDSPYIILKSQTLANLSIYTAPCIEIAYYFQDDLTAFHRLISLFCSNDPTLKGKFHFLAMLFGNLSSIEIGRKIFFNDDRKFLRDLLPFTTYGESATRRHGIAILLKNLAFIAEKHKWLLADVQILPALLLPLAGPEAYRDEEMEKLPLELQYLPEDQMREPNNDIKLCILEALYKLCCTRYGRTYLRDKNVYFVLRNLHENEKDLGVISHIDQIVGILIRDEEDIGVDNMGSLDIPQDVVDSSKQLTIRSPYYC